MASRVIDVALKLRDAFTGPMKGAISSLTSFDKEGARVRKSVEKVGKGIAGVGTAMTAAVTVPLAGLATASAAKFGEVDKSLKLVQQTMGSTDEQAKVLEGAIKKAAANSVYGMQDAADAALNYARQGFSAAQAADMIAPAMHLAAGTATDLAAVTGGVGNAMKIFADQGLEAESAANMLAKAQAQANTTVTDLFEAMSTAGPMLDSVGWSFKDLAVVTDVFGDAGISGSEGATALKTGLARLASPAADGAAAMKKLNLQFFDSVGKMDDLQTMQKKLHESFVGLNDQERMSAAAAIFGKNQMAKWMTLINAAPETFAQYSKGLEDSGGAAKSMADALLSGPGGAVEKLKSSFDVLEYTIGGTVGNAFMPAIEKATDLLDAFNNMDESQRVQIIRWTAIAAAMGPGLVIFGKMVTGAAGVFRGISMINKAGGAMRLILGAVSSPAAAVVVALLAVVAVIAVIVTHIDQFKAAWGAMGSEISPEVAELKNAFVSLMQQMQPFASFASGAFVAAVLGGFQGMGTGIGIVIQGVTIAVQGLTTLFGGIAMVIQGITNGDLGTALDGLKTVFSGAFEFICGMIQTTVGAIGTIAGAVKGAVSAVGSFASGKGKNSKIPENAHGTPRWGGGITRVNEKGGEIMDLPSGTRIIPHDASRNTPVGGNVSISKLADTIVVREDADIDKIGDAIVRKIQAAGGRTGGYSYSGDMA